MYCGSVMRNCILLLLLLLLCFFQTKLCRDWWPASRDASGTRTSLTMSIWNARRTRRRRTRKMSWSSRRNNDVEAAWRTCRWVSPRWDDSARPAETVSHSLHLFQIVADPDISFGGHEAPAPSPDNFFSLLLKTACFGRFWCLNVPVTCTHA